MKKREKGKGKDNEERIFLWMYMKEEFVHKFNVQ